MATQLANTLAVLDALADSLGKTLTPTQKAAIVEEFINDTNGTNEEKAAAFNALLVSIIRKVGRSHVRRTAEASHDAEVEAAVAGANSNF